jgi:hypothetical protein
VSKEPATADATPIACTLDASEMVGRLEEWRATLEQATSRAHTDSGSVRFELDDRTDIADLARLVAAEQRCCAFLSFAITVDDRGLGLEISAPDEGRAVLDDLFALEA